MLVSKMRISDEPIGSPRVIASITRISPILRRARSAKTTSERNPPNVASGGTGVQSVYEASCALVPCQANEDSPSFLNYYGSRGRRAAPRRRPPQPPRRGRRGVRGTPLLVQAPNCIPQDEKGSDVPARRPGRSLRYCERAPAAPIGGCHGSNECAETGASHENAAQSPHVIFSHHTSPRDNLEGAAPRLTFVYC